MHFLLSHQVGLAVDDIKGVQEQAVLKRLAMQVRRRSLNEMLVSLLKNNRWAKEKFFLLLISTVTSSLMAPPPIRVAPCFMISSLWFFKTLLAMVRFSFCKKPREGWNVLYPITSPPNVLHQHQVLVLKTLNPMQYGIDCWNNNDEKHIATLHVISGELDHFRK